jgi:hypothetical protein
LEKGKLRDEIANDLYNGDPFKTLALIETKCHTISNVSLKDLKRELTKFVMENREKLESVVDRLDTLVKQLANQNHKVEDDVKRDVLIESLVNNQWDKVREKEQEKVLDDENRLYMTTLKEFAEEEKRQTSYTKNCTQSRGSTQNTTKK